MHSRYTNFCLRYNVTGKDACSLQSHHGSNNLVEIVAIGCYMNWILVAEQAYRVPKFVTRKKSACFRLLIVSEYHVGRQWFIITHKSQNGFFWQRLSFFLLKVYRMQQRFTRTYSSYKNCTTTYRKGLVIEISWYCCFHFLQSNFW